MSAIFEEHACYVQDGYRLAAYRSALREVVRQGDVVLDLGSGTGLLGLLACEVGAARVYCVDVSRMTDVARRVAEASGYRDRLHILRGHSEQVDLPERADVVVADQMAPFGVGAGLVESFADARRRHLREGARGIPGRLELWVTLAQVPRVRRDLDDWCAEGLPAGLAVVRELASHDPRWLEGDQVRPLGPPARFADLDLMQAEPGRLGAQMEWRAEQAGEADALVGFFSAELGGGARVTNAPLVEPRLDREVLVLPLERSLQVDPSRLLTLRLHVEPANMLMGWQVAEASAPSQPCIRQTSLPSLLVQRGDLPQCAPGYRPRLSRVGLARRRVFALCDGTRSTAELANAVRAEHPDLFRSEERARRFVLRVLEGHIE